MASPPSVIPRSLAMLSAVCVLSLPLSVLGNEVEEKQTIQKTFVFDDARAARQVEVDNFEGSIQIFNSKCRSRPVFISRP